MNKIGFFYKKLIGNRNLIEGKIYKIGNKEYILKEGILRVKNIYSDTQEQTKNTFEYKWYRRDTYEAEHIKETTREWLIKKYVGGDPNLLKKYCPQNSKFLDAGCGSGFSALLLFDKTLPHLHYLGADISGAIDVAKKRFKEEGLRGEFIQTDILDLPSKIGSFDVIFSEGVLHHTDSTKKSLKILSEKLCRGGIIMFYIYKKKGSVREFTDDYIRSKISTLSNEEAWEKLKPLTKLGKILGDLNTEITINDNIELLDIPKGTYNLQRFFYYHLMKTFYRPEYSLEEMNHINFDWYRPSNAHRHSKEEVKEWCKKFSLKIERLHVDDSGITVIARKIKNVK